MPFLVLCNAYRENVMGFAAGMVVAGLIAAVGLIQMILALRQGDRVDEELAEVRISADYGTNEHSGLLASRGSAIWLLTIAAALAGAVLAGLTFELAVSVAVLLVLLPTAIAFAVRFVANRVNRGL